MKQTKRELERTIFEDIVWWLLKNHDHFPYDDGWEEFGKDGEPYVMSMVFQKWLRKHLDIPEDWHKSQTWKERKL